MFSRFESIKNCGIWANYAWDSALPQLGRINVIYGPNGSGKTSLSGALDGLRNSADGMGYTRLSIALDESGTERITNGLDDVVFDRVRVFSEHYVARSHRFTPAEAEMDAVLTIGEKPIETELRLEELRNLVGEESVKLEAESEKERSSSLAIDAAYRRVSQQVVDAVSNAGGRWHSRSNFSAGTVRNAFVTPHSPWTALPEEELRTKIGLVNSSKSDLIPDIPLIVESPDALVGRLTAALAASPATVILNTLSGHPMATTWVDEGRHLHDGIDVCLFCGGPLTAERRALIEQHFSDEVTRVQDELRAISRELRILEASVGSASTAVPAKGLFFDDLKGRYDAAAQSLLDELSKLRTWAQNARSRAESKAANVLNIVDSEVDDPPTIFGTDFLALRTEHNERVARHDFLVQAAATAVELHYLKAAETEVRTNQKTATDAHDEIQRISAELQVYRDEIISLESVDGDPLPSAKVLTEEVTRLLGRDELKFEAVDGKYHVTRDGQPALGLSMGERTAITLVHFLESVARIPASDGKPIVVIDDPVSSLDSDIFMGVSSYIWTEVVAKEHIAQIILLTHNFELFRQWDIQMDGLRNGKLADGRKCKDVYPEAFYEIRSSHTSVAGSSRPKRRPRLSAWPPTPGVRNKMRSSYQHSFIVVAQALQELKSEDSMERKLDAQILFPNVVRRMLETFLAFKHPERVGDFTGAMRKSKELLERHGYVGDADALRLRLTRYLHAHSHSETAATDITISPDEVATAIGAVFEFMKCLDSDHFQGLCEVASIDPASLLPPVPVAGNPSNGG